jgi:elongation factor G
MAEHLVEIAIGPMSEHAQQLLRKASARAPQSLGSFAISFANGYGVIAGESLSQLALLINWLRREVDLVIVTGFPQVAYRETLGAPATVDYTHQRRLGHSGQFARVVILFEPLAPGGGRVFAADIADGALPQDCILAVEKGLEAVAESGVIAGFPVIDYKATLLDAAYHDEDSSPLAFEIAARAAFREAAKNADAKLLEPWMKVEVLAPNEHAAPIVRDLSRRRARPPVCRRQGAEVVVEAEAPLANLFQYEDSLAAITGGRAQLTMAFSRYAPVPPAPEPPDDDDFRPAVGMRP